MKKVEKGSLYYIFACTKRKERPEKWHPLCSTNMQGVGGGPEADKRPKGDAEIEILSFFFVWKIMKYVQNFQRIYGNFPISESGVTISHMLFSVCLGETKEGRGIGVRRDHDGALKTL